MIVKDARTRDGRGKLSFLYSVMLCFDMVSQDAVDAGHVASITQPCDLRAKLKRRQG